jgi:2-acylglycerol O-acyltransferase 2
MSEESAAVANEKENRSQKKKILVLDRIPKVHWAPLRGIPLKRRLQTLAIVIWMALLPICLIIYLYLFTIPLLWPLLIMYTIWLYFDKAPENGGRRITFVRKLRLWKYFSGYFPVSLIKVKYLVAASDLLALEVVENNDSC